MQASGYVPESVADGTGGYGYNPRYDPATSPRHDAFEGRRPRYSWQNPGFAQSDEHPVVNVTWNDAVALARWLSLTERRRYRLPTEAEWEYACRAGTRTQYHGGDDPASLAAVANVFDADSAAQWPQWQAFALPTHDGYAFTAPVGRFAPNAFGLHDMHGNVWEWTADWHDDDYYARSQVDDPQGPADGRVKVRRGGSWHTWPLYARCAYRNWNATEHALHAGGHPAGDGSTAVTVTRRNRTDAAGWKRRHMLVATLGLLLRPAAAEPPPLPAEAWPRALAVPGGVARVPLGAAAGRPAAFDGEVPLLVQGGPAGWIALVGIPLAAAPGEARIQLRPADGGAARDIGYTIAPKRYAEQRLRVAPRHVDLSPEDLARHERERAHQAGVMAIWTDHRRPRCRCACLCRAGARRPSACAACSTARRATRTAAWTSPRPPARRWWRRWPAA